MITVFFLPSKTTFKSLLFFFSIIRHKENIQYKVIKESGEFKEFEKIFVIDIEQKALLEILPKI